MNDKKMAKELRKKLSTEDITLPESLSAENIEKLINEEGAITSPKRNKDIPKGKIIKFIASAAAVIVMIVGLSAVLRTTVRDIELKTQDNVIAQKTENSDYSKIETAVFAYFKDYYNNMSDRFGYAYNDKTIFSYNAVSADNADSAAPESSGMLDSAATGTNGSADYNKTNLQVNGVDEGDIIKNDGRYIYYLRDDKILINDCLKPEKMKTVSEIKLFSDAEGSSYARDMYLYGDKLVVLIQKAKPQDNLSVYNGSAIDCYDCYYDPYNDTVIHVYDISDKENPEIVYTQLINGSYISSRVIDNKLLTVAEYNIPYSSCTQDSFDESCDVLKEVTIPQYSVNGGEYIKIPSDRINLIDEDDPEAYVVTALVNLDDLDASPILDASLSSGWEIYCTSQNLFIATSEYNYDGYYFDGIDDEAFDNVTRIYKYDITDEGVLYKAEATVGGTWLNQFSMDQYGDSFRIVTNGFVSKVNKNDKKAYSYRIDFYDNSDRYSSDRYSMVYIFDKDMNIKGYLGGIARGENIYAARFMGETLYLVTFYQTDPLFVIDLSDETNPTVKGELKIPGFSSYLHPVGNDLVIGIGRGGTDNGTDGSAKVSLFDVSDPENPKEIDNYTVGDAFFSENHKTVMNVDEDTIGMCLTEWYTDYQYNYKEKYSVLLLDFAANGLSIHGKYEALPIGDGIYGPDYLRGAFIGNTLYAIDNAGIVSYSMTDNEKLGELKF